MLLISQNSPVDFEESEEDRGFEIESSSGSTSPRLGGRQE